MTMLRLYSDGTATTISAIDEFVQRLRDSDVDYGWIDLTTAEQDALQALAERLDLHALAVEDALSTHERPRLARFAKHRLLTLSTTRFDSEDVLHLERCTAFLLERLVITVREPEFPMDRVVAHLDDNYDLAPHGVGFVVWGLVDVTVDGHVDDLAEISESVEGLTDVLFTDQRDTLAVQQRAFELRHALQRLHRVTLPMREVVNTLLRRDNTELAHGLEPYFNDVYDHTVHAAEWADSLRDQISTVLETNVALQGNQMNEVMKKVTSWAAIIAVPTFITGYFGQNLEFPFFSTVPGWWISNGIIVGGSLTLYFVFRRSNWL